MPYTRILIHAVWATKDRKPLMQTENRNALIAHIRQIAVEKNIHLLNVNGYVEHLHCLISLKSDQSISTVR
ncbi:MAG: hypothetical protein JWO06_465 [Bacteroidota bacterium]|nr:hypothetical protein [Bacteroidota bacterium]